MFLAGENRYTAQQDNFAKIPGSPVAYWVSETIFQLFASYPPLTNIARPTEGITTGDNERTLRFWFEVSVENSYIWPSQSNDNKWHVMYKGGEYRKWYGNLEYLVLWGDNGKLLKESPGSVIRSERLYYQPAVWWTYISSGIFSCRADIQRYLHNTKGPACYTSKEYEIYILALLNSNVVNALLQILAPTIARKPGDLSGIPIVVSSSKTRNEVEKLALDALSISRHDWDSYETSWDFQRDPLVRYAEPNGFLEFPNWGVNMKLEQGYKYWKAICEHRFQMLKANEKELNRIFIDIYGLQDELTPEVADKDVTVHRVFDTKEDVPESMQGSAYVRTKRDEVVSLISYAVGCMFGRYSLSKPGLAFAGGAWDAANYTSEFQPDQGGILPICDDDYFTDDIVGRFVRFIEVVYGEDTLEENLKFIADALGGPSRAGSKGTPRQVIRSYFLSDFYADHCKTYQKRPIYWLFDSGKKNGFKCLIYMHRYAPDTIARIRTDYVHEQQSRYRTAIADLENRVASASTAERVKLQKQLAKLRDQAEETRVYEEKIHHYADQMIAIDLDDGVKVNYAKFQDVLGKIK